MEKIMNLALLTLLPMSSADSNIGWTSPGDVCVCEGNDISLEWSYVAISNPNIIGYAFCYNPINIETVVCEKTILYKDYHTGNITLDPDFKKRLEFLGSHRRLGRSDHIGIKFHKASTRDEAIYSVLIQGTPYLNTNCKLSVVKGIKNISIVITDTQGFAVADNAINASTPYTVNVYYDGSGYDATVTLKINNSSTVRKSCPSPCSFQHEFTPGIINIIGNASTCQCSVSNKITLRAIPIMSTIEPTAEQTMLRALCISTGAASLSLIVQGIIVFVLYRKRKGDQAAQYNISNRDENRQCNWIRSAFDVVFDIIESDYEHPIDNSTTSMVYFILSWYKKICLLAMFVELFIWIISVLSFECTDIKLCLLMLLLIQLQECKWVSQAVVELRKAYLNLDQTETVSLMDKKHVKDLQFTVRSKLLGFIILESFIVACFAKSCLSKEIIYVCFTDDLFVTINSFLACLLDYTFNMFVFTRHYRLANIDFLKNRFKQN